MSDRKPAYWAVLPAKVRYDTSLRPNAKLLYAEITALAGASGYCWATNEYLAQLFGIAARTVTDLVAQLAKCGYIRVEVVRNPETNEVLERRLWVDLSTPPDAGAALPPIAKNGDTPPAENSGTPIAENGAENNLKIFNNIPPISPQGEVSKLDTKTGLLPKHKPERFQGFWDYYPRHVKRDRAVAAWDKLKPDDELIGTMGRALAKQVAYWNAVGKELQFIPHAASWINQQRWNDPPEEYQLSGRTAQPSGGWADSKEVL